MFPCKDSTLNNSLGNAIFPSQRLVTTSASLRTQTGLHCLILQVLNTKSLLLECFPHFCMQQFRARVGNFNREPQSAQIRITQPSLPKSKAEVRAKPHDSPLYHAHLNPIKPVLSGFSQFQPTRATGVKR